jgi:eukaryotic-like serine/threonine-protein kinase
LHKLAVPAVPRRPAIKYAAVAVVLVAIAGGVLLWQHAQAKPLTDKDVLVLADFINTTGDPVFDVTLRVALAAQLEESPFLKIMSDDRVRLDLGLMGRSPNERITNDLARDMCQREGEKAMIGGSIASLGRNYAITLESTNCRTGDTLAREQLEAPDKEHVLEAVGKAAKGMRQKLGESLSSIQKLEPPRDRVTTVSLPAFQSFAQGVVLLRRGAFLEAIPLFQRAAELDPNFAMAWNYLGASNIGAGEYGPRMAGALARAFELRDRVTELERFQIAVQYFLFVTQEWSKAAETGDLWSRTYPRNHIAHHNFALAQRRQGEMEEALREDLEAYRIEPRNSFVHTVLVDIYAEFERFDEAKKVAETELAQNPDEAALHDRLFRIASIQGDDAAAARQIAWFTSRREEYLGLQRQAEAAKVHGRLREADDFLRRASELRQRRSLPPSPGRSAEEDALLGKCDSTRAASAPSAVALALCGDAAQTSLALKRVVDASAQRPGDTLLNAIQLPMLRAASEFKRNQPEKAVDLLQPVKRYERRADVSYLRGLSYLRARKGAEAVAEFQKMIDRKGTYWGPFYPVSYVGLARAAALAGDAPKARKAYQDFLALWKDADADIPILIEAKKEYAALQQ